MQLESIKIRQIVQNVWQYVMVERVFRFRGVCVFFFLSIATQWTWCWQNIKSINSIRPWINGTFSFTMFFWQTIFRSYVFFFLKNLLSGNGQRIKDVSHPILIAIRTRS